MKIEIIITNTQNFEEFALGASRSHFVELEKSEAEIKQKGICLTPEQYKVVYEKLEEIKQTLNQL